MQMKASATVFEVVSWTGSEQEHYLTPGDSEAWCGEAIGGDAERRPYQQTANLCPACWQIRQHLGGDGE